MRDNPEVRYTLARPWRQRQASHVRARRLIFILVAILLYLLAVGISLAALVSGSHYWGINATQASCPNEAWCVTWSDRGLSNDYNIQVGDQILMSDGHAPQSVDEINHANTLQILPSGSYPPRLIQWQPPNGLDTILSLSWFFIGLVSLLLGVLVFLHATQRALAIRFFLLWVGLAIASSLVPATSFGNLLAVHTANVLFIGPSTGLLVSFLWLLLFPPSPSPASNASSQPGTPGQQTRATQRRWLPEVLIVTGLLVAAFFLSAPVLMQPDLLRASLTVSSVQTTLAITVSLFLILRKSLSRRPTIARERARTLLGGMIFGLAPILVFTVIPGLFSAPALVPGTISSLPIVALPLSFGYAIVRRDLLRVDSLIRNTTLALLGLIGMAVTAVLLAQALVLLPTVPAIILGIVAGAVLTPIIWAGARWLTEAWLFPQVRQYRKLIAQGESSERTGLDPERLVGQLIGEVHLALPVRQVAVFAPDKHTGRLVALPAPPTGARSGEHTTSETSRGVVALSPSSEPTTQEQKVLLIEDSVYSRLAWEGGVALIEPVPALKMPPAPTQAQEPRISTPLPAPAEEAAQERGGESDLESWHLLVPMRVRGRLVGILTLSRREDDQTYADTDLRLLRFLCGRRALALDYALLYADLHRAFEERRELDRLKDQFIVTAHHELRTPLTGIQGYLELLRDLGPEGRLARPQETALFIERACLATDQLGEQLNGLLTAAEADLSQDHLNLKPVEVTKVAQRAIRSLSAVAQRGNHRIHNKILPELVAIADEESLYRILLNLLSNALKYSPDGRPVLFEGHALPLTSAGGRESIKGSGATAPSSDRQMAEILVRDWGMGITRSDQQKIFERFTRLERDLNSPVRGNGLGLAISKGLVEAMGGTISVESDGRRGEGSTFFVRLPLAESSPPSLPSSG